MVMRLVAKPVGSSSDPIATKLCIGFLKGPAAIRVIRSKGMELVE
jgi:hypothetical protein